MVEKNKVYVTDEAGIQVWDANDDFRVGIAADFSGPDGMQYGGETQLVVRGKPAGHAPAPRSGTSATTKADDVFVFSSHWASLWLGRQGGNQAGTLVRVTDDGSVEESDGALDRRVVGIVSGAGGLKPGVTLDKREEATTRVPIALAGKAYCKVDASHGAICPGDLLVSSPTAGHAMVCREPAKGWGCVVGKALQGHVDGCGEVLVLVGGR